MNLGLAKVEKNVTEYNLFHHALQKEKGAYVMV